MLDIAQVHTFVAIVEASSLSVAAERLHMSQPAVSQHLRKLERALGMQLLRRDRKGCRLTAEGERLLPHARALIKSEARCRSAFTGELLTVAASSNIGTYHLPKLIQSYREQRNNHDLVYDVFLGTNKEVYRRLETHEADIGLTEWWDHREGFRALEWQLEPLVVIVRPGHKWARTRGISANDLVATPLIGGEAGTGTLALLREVLGQKVSQLRVSMTLGSTEAVKQAVMAGLGVSLVIRSAVEREIETGLLVALDVTGAQLKKRFYAILPKRTSETSPSCQFASFLIKRKKVNSYGSRA